VCADRDAAVRQLDAGGFAYLPLAHLCPGLDRLLRLRNLLGLRSPINTAARLLNPFDAAAGVDGVFHPPYIALHLNTAALLQRGRLVVVKGGGGEAERNPVKPMTAHWFDRSAGQGEAAFDAVPATEGPNDLLETWRGGTGPGASVACASIALGLLALGVAGSAREADARAAEVWAARL
jgi:anthranilate phosphoribosyltransferase